ncbi:LysE/ArgO family amino acid transporter [Paracoccus sp. (in: a-proteobacteria)]|uniref:LysE/ArgO family amino acid transporter n=1 Tax=Paracoccus sp. TaxID=267 RepID=UPI0026E096E3|nr:LysE/ArgO family amino acid transporter [Paracoccus sp. (in: a-proteobacteria)]MDO5646821.1 LysE/ArgO family amino acid transporter [Paracoccus sp. (in: a-proteobacteria)]
MVTFLSGFGTGLSLIMAIGAQNAFVLKQGLLRQHVFVICLFCAVSDAFLIGLGVAGMAGLERAIPWIIPAMRWGGAAFLLAYGARSFLAAWRGGQSLEASGSVTSLTTSLMTIAALTWLNPHVYLDTVVLLGSIAAQMPDRWVFAAGAMTGSFVFFFGLGYGARLLQPLFRQPRAWQVLDAAVGAVMWLIAAKLIWA